MKEETIKQMVKAGMSTKEIAVEFGVTQRSVQKWLKALGLNRSISQAHKLRRQLIKRKESVSKNEKEPKVKKEPKFKKVQGDFAIYRFLDRSGQVLYVGKCERSVHSNGHGGERDYFLKERITQHFAPSCKHLPQFVYNSTMKIEYIIVDTIHECLNLEDDLILHYKMKNQCVWNGKFSISFNDECNIDKIKWLPYWQRETKEYLC